MNIEMMTKNPQRSDWSLEEDTIIKCQNAFSTNKESNVISINTSIDVNNDESRRDEKTKLRSLCSLPQCCSSIPPCCQGLILGILTATLLLAIAISLLLASLHKTSTTKSITTQISIASTTTTITTTPPYCATTCTSNLTNYDNTTTCGHMCVDSGSFICQNSSTYCAGGTFSINGNCNAGNGDGPCPSGYCCVFDTYSSSAPYYCMICNAVG